jgi:restriction system protein
MAKGGGFQRGVNAVAREMSRAAARAQREAAMAERARLRESKLLERQRLHDAREARREHAEARAQEVEDRNEDLRARIDELQSILVATLAIDDRIDFGSLKAPADHPGRLPFAPPDALKQPAPLPDRNRYASAVRSPSWSTKLFPGWQKRYARRLELAEAEFQRALDAWKEGEAARVRQLDTLRAQSEQARKAVEEHDQQVEEFADSYQAGSPDAIVSYTEMVLERSEYPGDFPQRFRVAYVPESRKLVIDYDLPGPSIVPAVTEYKYVRTRDSIEEKTRKPADIKSRYADVVASIALRTIHEVLEADQANHLDVVVLSGFVHAVDPATGKDTRPCLISVSVSKQAFNELDLARVDKKVCLRNLGAQVSPSPEAVQAVKPIVDFDMVDRRFVAGSDVLGDLESRANLMDLDPFEFENLVGNLFSKMGLETKQTRSSRDGGVDVVAYDVRPVLGGKVVIQAKRYRHTVGVAAVRDLYGTMINEGASKGILVTTSGYGPDAFEFAKDKPLELIQGGELLYLLAEIGVEARIVFPDEGAKV